MNLTPENKAYIDSLTYEQLLKKQWTASIIDPWFRGETGEYWNERIRIIKPLQKSLECIPPNTQGRFREQDTHIGGELAFKIGSIHISEPYNGFHDLAFKIADGNFLHICGQNNMVQLVENALKEYREKMEDK